MSNKSYSASDSYDSWIEAHSYDEQHRKSLVMSNSPSRAKEELSNASAPELDVSATQRMLSAVIGSLVTSLLGKKDIYIYISHETNIIFQ